MGEAMHLWRQEVYGEPLYLPLNFAVNLKLLFKSKEYIYIYIKSYKPLLSGLYPRNADLTILI